MWESRRTREGVIMKRRFVLFLTVAMAFCLLCFLPSKTALASDLSTQQVSHIVDDNSPRIMPVTRTYTTWATARSASTLGFAYIYLKVNAVVDLQSGNVIGINGAYSYQADASRNFVRWEQLSLRTSYGNRSIWGKATGYAYFKNPVSSLEDKYYLEIEHTWTL